MQDQVAATSDEETTADKETNTDYMLAVEAILFAIGGILLISGIVLAGSTASTVGRPPGYGLGLCLINVSAITIVGTSALHFHRRRIEDKRAENRKLAKMCAEIQKLNARIQALMLIEEKRSDQLAARRNGFG